MPNKFVEIDCISDGVRADSHLSRSQLASRRPMSPPDSSNFRVGVKRWRCTRCSWTEAPAWAVHNRYIHTGYRTGGGYVGALHSVRPHIGNPSPGPLSIRASPAVV